MKVLFTTTKAESIFCLPKPKCHMKERYKVIYKYECPMCKKCCIGGTKRIFFHRLGEHSSSQLADHHITCGSSSDFNQCFKILCGARSFKDLCVMESIYIHYRKLILNTQLVNGSIDYILSLRLF